MTRQHKKWMSSCCKCSVVSAVSFIAYHFCKELRFVVFSFLRKFCYTHKYPWQDKTKRREIHLLALTSKLQKIQHLHTRYLAFSSVTIIDVNTFVEIKNVVNMLTSKLQKAVEPWPNGYGAGFRTCWSRVQSQPKTSSVEYYQSLLNLHSVWS